MSSSFVTGIIPFTYFVTEQKPVGSTALRVDNLTACAPDFRKWVHGAKYDALIFQKAYWKEMMELFQGPKILDLCDPDWLRESIDIIELGSLVHAVTCSSRPLTELMQGYFPGKPVVYVPDRLLPSAFPPPRGPHSGPARKAVWFGFIHNACASLPSLVPALKAHCMELTILSNEPYPEEDEVAALRPDFIRYDPATAYTRIRDFDVVLNPRSQRAFFKYKSLNKSLIAWQLGLPVAVTPNDLDRLADPEVRNREVQAQQALIAREYHIEQSAAQYRELLQSLRHNL